jgi:hypothetical protein
VKLQRCDSLIPICKLYKLTDTHLSPVTQCDMKVSLSAQVMSHTEAAGIYTLVSAGKEVSSFSCHKK